MEEVMFYNASEGEELTLMDTDGGIMVEQGTVTYTIPDQQQLHAQVQQGQGQSLQQQHQVQVSQQQAQVQPQQIEQPLQSQLQQSTQNQQQHQVQQLQQQPVQQSQQQKQVQQPQLQVQQSSPQQIQQSQPQQIQQSVQQQAQQPQQQQVQPQRSQQLHQHQVQHVQQQQQHQVHQQQLMHQQQQQQATLYSHGPQQQQQQFVLQHQTAPVVVQQQVPQQMLQSNMLQHQVQQNHQGQQMVVHQQQQQQPQHIIMQQQLIPQHQQLIVQQPTQQQIIASKFILASSQLKPSPHPVIQYLPPPPQSQPQGQQQQQQLLQQQNMSQRHQQDGTDTMRKQMQAQYRQQQQLRQVQLSAHGQQPQTQIVQLNLSHQPHFQQQGGQQQQQLIPAQLMQQQDGQQPQQIAFIQSSVKGSEGLQYHMRLAPPSSGAGPSVMTSGGAVRPHLRQVHAMAVSPPASCPQPPVSHIQSMAALSPGVQQQQHVSMAKNGGTPTSAGVHQQLQTQVPLTPAQKRQQGRRAQQRQQQMAVVSSNVVSGADGPGTVMQRPATQGLVERPQNALTPRGVNLQEGPRPVGVLRQRMPSPGGQGMRNPNMLNRMPRYAQPQQMQSLVSSQGTHSAVMSAPATSQAQLQQTGGVSTASLLVSSADTAAAVSSCSEQQDTATTSTAVITSAPSATVSSSSAPLSTATSAPLNTAPQPSAPKKLSLDQYRNKQQQQLNRHPAPQGQATRFVPQHPPHNITSRELILNAKNKQVLLVMNSRGPTMGTMSAQHHVVKMQHDQLQTSAPDSTSSSAETEEQDKGSRYMPGHQAKCDNCGMLSDDLNKCLRCQKPILRTARLFPTNSNANMITSSASQQQQPQQLYVSGSHLIKQEFYGKTGGGRRHDKAASSSYGQRNCSSKPSHRGRGRGRTRAYDEPEILTLSSDEDEGNASSDGSVSTAKSGKAGQAGNPLQHGRVLPGLDNFQVKMDHIATEKEPVVPAPETTDSQPEEEVPCEMEAFNPAQSASHFSRVICRNVRIGSYRTTPSTGVIFSNTGIRIPVKPVLGGVPIVEVNIGMSDIIQVNYHFGKQMPVIFFFLKARAGARIRGVLGMHDPKLNYYDPCSLDHTLKRVVIMPEKVSEDSKTVIKNLLKNYTGEDGKKIHLEELTHEEANIVLIAASGPEVQAVVRQTAKSVSQFPQPSKTLLIYPPPPQKGGISITVDDYQVLEEESFLNDVILDFYLKWLLQSRLSEEQRNKVHLFSTFFYKRLTCKPKKMRRHHPIEDDPKLSAAEKRHARVKSWTKSVDIFDKDFIIIPINEHAHWFLAIICFPGLRGPVHYETNEPVSSEILAAEEAANMKKRTGKTKIRHEQIPIIDDGEWSDRDEAEGDEDELEEDDYDDEDSNQQPPRKKTKTGDQPIPGLGGDEDAQPAKTKITSNLPPIKQPCILIFDSLSGGHRARIVATLRDYLAVEHLHKRKEARTFNKETMKGCVPRVPQQTNYTDCGLYTLQFTESFFELPLKDYRFPMRSIIDWFDESIVAGKREYIALLIQDLMNKYNPNNNIKLPEISFSTPEEREKGGRASCQAEERERQLKISLEKNKDKAGKGKSDTKVPSADKIPLLGEDGVGRQQSTEDPGTALSGETGHNNSTSKVEANEDKTDTADEKSSGLSKLVVNSTNADIGTKRNQSSPISKVSKPILIRSDSQSGSLSKEVGKPVTSVLKGKKVVLGVIPSVKPFGSPLSKSGIYTSPVSKGSVATLPFKSASPGLASIKDAYSVGETNEEDDSNNNESSSSLKERAAVPVTRMVTEVSTGGTVASVQVSANMARSTAATVARLNNRTTSKNMSVNGVVTDQGSNGTTLSSGITTVSPLQEDVAHLNKYPILASSLGNGRRVSSEMSESSNKSKTENDVSSTDSVDEAAVNPHIGKVGADKPVPEKVIFTEKNGHLNEILVGEISGKKAVYSEDGSEVLMYLSPDESGCSPTEREGSLSPDMDSNTVLDEGNKNTIEDSAKESEGSQDSNSTISVGNEMPFIPTQSVSSGNKSVSSASSVSSISSTCIEGTPSGGNSPSTAGSRSCERVTSSGRFINTPKRFRDLSNPEETRKKKTKGNHSGHR
ncbi:Ulp1 protease family C-terminal catalytic domain [Trinorchestia longiramus]|nr:Ulp1 protease family C-terminal catalytic domain [Trinorchestia longiramus]